MPGGGIVNNEATNITQRSSDDDRVDLDYEEDIVIESLEDNKALCSNSAGSKSPDQSPVLNDEVTEEDKEEGELEDGEITDSDEEVKPVKETESKLADKKPIALNSPDQTPQSKGDKKDAPAKDKESPWEKGLREAREAMRRANKAREDPDYEEKRLLAAPVRRSSRTDSDHSPSPFPRRKNNSKSKSPRRIPSLLDIRTSTPPRRIPPKDLGPQVIYPNGRPCPKREPESRDRRERDRRRTPSPPRREHRDSLRKHDSRSEKTNKSKNDDKRKKVPISTSPISSDTESSSAPKKSKKFEQNDINDPWARKKTNKDKTAGRKRRSRSSSSEASISSRSTITGRRKYARYSSSSSSDSDSDIDRRKKLHKKSSSKGKNKNRKEKNPVEEFFSKKKSDLPAAFRKRSRRTSSSDSDEDIAGIKDISGSDSDASSNSSKSSKHSSPVKYRKKAKSPSPISDDSELTPPPPPPTEKFEDISPPDSPPKKKSKDSIEPEEEVRSKRKDKAALLKQLREVEEELEKHRVIRMGTAH